MTKKLMEARRHIIPVESHAFPALKALGVEPSIMGFDHIDPKTGPIKPLYPSATCERNTPNRLGRIATDAVTYLTAIATLASVIINTDITGKPEPYVSSSTAQSSPDTVLVADASPLEERTYEPGKKYLKNEPEPEHPNFLSNLR